MNEPDQAEPRPETALNRREVLIKGGLATAGAAFLGAPLAASAAVERGARGPRSLKIAVITHGAGDAFWSVAHKGASAAGSDLGIKVLYSEGRNDPQKQAQLIQAAVSQKVKGIATSLPSPSAMKDALNRARAAHIPVITLNSGENQFKSLGAITHVGQDESVAGKGAGRKLKGAGLKKLLVVIHEQANIGLEQRYSGAKAGFGNAARLQVTGLSDVSATTQQIQSKLTADRGIDAVLTLNPQIATAAQQAIAGAHSKAKLATFDLSSDVINAIQKGTMLFAIDQQQYLQGYLPVVFLYLFNTNLNTVGGGQPVLTGPGFVEKSNAAKVKALTAKGTR
ncbi:MAG: substrate-binding domain-containing protein [Gaiellaceae bacterium]